MIVMLCVKSRAKMHNYIFLIFEQIDISDNERTNERKKEP